MIVRYRKRVEYNMNNVVNDILLFCFVCKEKLIKDVLNKMYKCINNYIYDIVKEGYVNLLISN